MGFFKKWADSVKTQLALEKMVAEELGIRECDAHDWLQANVEHRRVLKNMGVEQVRLQIRARKGAAR